jgi:hypothetical protein
MFFKQHKSETDQPIFSINYYRNNDYKINIKQDISSEDMQNIASFIFLLSYQSPIFTNLFDKIKITNTGSTTDAIINYWSTLYYQDKNYPMVNPLNAFQKNVKQY